jgi:hypothetical protein
MRDRNKNETERTGAMDEIKYFFTNNYGKIALFIVASGIIVGLYTLTQNMKAVLS